MKYIRTKDDIYDEKKYEIAKSLLVVFRNANALLPFEEDKGDLEIINQADTIEELCDEFVFENEIVVEGKYSIMDRKTFETIRKAICEASKITHKKCYGAIWTDKGLIYVAKMNEKGELELL